MDSHINPSIPSVPNNLQRGSGTKKSLYLVHNYFSGGQILYLLNMPFKISFINWQFSPVLDISLLTLSSLWLKIRNYFIYTFFNFTHMNIILIIVQRPTLPENIDLVFISFYSSVFSPLLIHLQGHWFWITWSWCQNSTNYTLLPSGMVKIKALFILFSLRKDWHMFSILTPLSGTVFWKEMALDCSLIVQFTLKNNVLKTHLLINKAAFSNQQPLGHPASETLIYLR